MGYRPQIIDKEHPELEYYGTKLYGYVSDNEKLKSMQYLVKIGKVNAIDAKWFEYSGNDDIVLTARQFRKWVCLYIRDIKWASENDEQYAYLPLDKEIINKLRKIAATKSEKEISWG